MHYLCTLSTHTMDYINAATSGILSPQVLPVTDLQNMLQHIADTLPPTLHLPIPPVDTLHFYRYLCTHVLIKNKQFLLLIDIPIQDRAHQITIHQVFTLDIPHGNYSAHYDITTKYFGVTEDATMGLDLSSTQFEVCQQANGQFCCISTPFQPLANLPTCISALYAKSTAHIKVQCSLQLCKAPTTTLPTQITPDVWILATPASAPTDTISVICPEKPMETIPIRQSLHILKLPMACSATTSHFYLPLRYESPALNVNVSLDMANLQAINITALHFCIWQHMGRNCSDIQLQHLATIPSIPIHKVYEHLLNSSLCLTPFNMKPSVDTNTLWNLFTHPGIYISSLGSLIPDGNWIILLLFILVLTCQNRALTFTIR